MKIIYILLAIVISSCSNSNEVNNQMQVKYYKSWSGYSHPINPKGELSESDLREYENSYYIATYIDKRLVSFKKIYKQEFMYEYKYYYNEAVQKRIGSSRDYLKVNYKFPKLIPY